MTTQSNTTGTSRASQSTTKHSLAEISQKSSVKDMEDTSHSVSRRSGLLYLSVIIFGIFAEVTRQAFIVSGDATATASRIMADPFRYRLSLVSDILMIVSFLLLALSLYRDLHHIDTTKATAFLVFVIVCIPILMINLFNQYAPLVLMDESITLSAFTTEQRESLSFFFITMHGKGYIFAQVFFGLWLLPLGLVSMKSESIHNIVGILLVLASVSQLIDVMVIFLFPAISATVTSILLPTSTLGEFAFAIWILVKGIPVSR